MKLRIARKMDQKPRHRGRWQRPHDKRVWWQVYNVEQLKRAEQRLHQSWRRACPLYLNDGKLWRGVSPDFFRGNRVQSRWQRQAAIRRYARERAAK